MIGQFRKIRYYNIPLAIILVISSLIIGVAGFMIIEKISFVDALYMAIITISTVGFGEVIEPNQAAKIFTIVLIVIYIGVFTYSVTVITTYVLDGDFRKNLRKYKMEKKIAKLQKHVIVIGYGRNGRECCKELSKNNVPFVVIEKNPDIIGKIQEDNFLFISGDATEDETLLATNIREATSLITTLPVDADNVFVVLTARKLCHKISITSRAANASSEAKLLSAGANHVVMPEVIGGHYMANLVTRPTLIEFYHLMTEDVDSSNSTEEIGYEHLREEFRDKTISEMNFRRKSGVNIIAIKDPDGKFIINPSPETKATAKSKIIALGTPGQIQEMKRIYTIS